MTDPVEEHQTVLVLDFGSQYTQLIARRVRERGVYSEIHPWDMDDDAIRTFAPSGVILSGGPESVNLEKPPRVSHAVRRPTRRKRCRRRRNAGRPPRPAWSFSRTPRS